MRYLTEENTFKLTNRQKGVFYFKNVENYIYVTDNFLKINTRVGVGIRTEGVGVPKINKQGGALIRYLCEYGLNLWESDVCLSFLHQFLSLI